LSNVRQLGNASLLYAQDNDGYFPPFRNVSPGDDCETTYSSTSGICAPSLLYASLNSYVRSKPVWFCPSDPVAGQDVDRWQVNHLYSSYFFNNRRELHLRDDGYWTGRRKIEPSEYGLISDANYGYILPPPPPNVEQPTPGAEHFGGINTFFLDGHAKWEKPSH
jgi:prepilin-type processing-associated H-X9-DG protein